LSLTPSRELWLADYVYDGLGRPRVDAAVLVQVAPEPARVLAVGAAALMRMQYPEVPVRPRVQVIAPPPVNAHTHLDLSAMPLTPGRYVDFVQRVVAYNRTGGRGLVAAEQGLAELRAAGVGVVGDIVTDEGVLARLLQDRQLRGVAYWEVLEPDPAAADRIIAEVEGVVRRFRPLERPGGVRLGLAPHAPHTLSAPLWRRVTALARTQGLPLQVHVAEDAAELPLHARGEGSLREAFGPFLAAFVPSGRTPIAYLDELGVLAARPTLVHGVHVDDDDLRRLQRAGCVVVHCPRSNALLRSGTFPWAAYARHGVSVALGTDSRASSPSLSPVDEWGAAVAIHGVRADPAQLLWSAVKGGYRALGCEPPRITRGMLASGLMRWPAAQPWPAAAGGATAGLLGDVASGAD
jgi:cytosine/adenosine deaminase-related metal-dependent hydrolase